MSSLSEQVLHPLVTAHRTRLIKLHFSAYVIIHTQDLNLCLLVLWYFKTTYYSKLKLVAQAGGLEGGHFVFGLHSMTFFFASVPVPRL